MQTSEIPPSVTVKYRSVSRDNERISKREVAQIGERGQLVGWYREVMSNVTGVRAEFVHAASDDLAPRIIQSSSQLCV